MLNFQCPEGWLSIATIDMHTAGEPLRVITAGLPTIEGHTVLENKRFFRARFDHLRTGLMFEPRGHADMYGAVLTPSRRLAESRVYLSATSTGGIDHEHIRFR